MFVLDSHCDTPSQIFRLRDMTLDNDHSHVDFPKLRRGGIDGAFGPCMFLLACHQRPGRNMHMRCSAA